MVGLQRTYFTNSDSQTKLSEHLLIPITVVHHSRELAGTATAQSHAEQHRNALYV